MCLSDSTRLAIARVTTSQTSQCTQLLLATGGARVAGHDAADGGHLPRHVGRRTTRRQEVQARHARPLHAAGGGAQQLADRHHVRHPYSSRQALAASISSVRSCNMSVCHDSGCTMWLRACLHTIFALPLFCIGVQSHFDVISLHTTFALNVFLVRTCINHHEPHHLNQHTTICETRALHLARS